MKLSLILISFIFLSSQLYGQFSEKSALRQQYEAERQALRSAWNATVRAYEQQFNRNKANAFAHQELELNSDSDSVVVSSNANLDSNFLSIEAIALGKNRDAAIRAVEKAVARYLLKKARELTRVSKESDIERLKKFLNSASEPLIKELTYLNNGHIQARYKIQVPLLGQTGLLFRFSDQSAANENKPVVEEDDDQNYNAYTGLILDARQFSPPSNIVIYIQHGDRVLYEPAIVEKDQAIKNGLVRYHSNLDAAKQDALVGENPLLVVPEKIENFRTYFVNKKAAKILSSSHFQNQILKNCRVCVVK